MAHDCPRPFAKHSWGVVKPADPEIVPVESPRETNAETPRATNSCKQPQIRNSQESGSTVADHSPLLLPNPQQHAPCLFVPWKTVARSVGIPEVQADPSPNLRRVVSHGLDLLPESVQIEVRAELGAVLQNIPEHPEHVETLASLVLEASATSEARTSLWASWWS